MTKEELIEEMRQAIIGMGNSAINCQDVAQRYAKQKAIEFQRWIYDEGWQRSNRNPDRYYQPPATEAIDYKTTEQLFDIFNSEV